MHSAKLALLLGLGLAACDHSSSGSATPSGASPSASTAPSAPTPPPAASSSAAPEPSSSATEGMGHPPRLADADVEGLEKLLKCSPATAAKPGPCKVLSTMEKCSEWSAVAPSGDGRWIGHGWQVTGGTTTDTVTLLRAKKVPQSEVKPWQLPIKIALSSIPKDAGPAFAQADRAITAYARHDVPPAKNAAVDFVKQKSDWGEESPAARTMGAMVETFSDHPTYACQGPGQQIEIIQQGADDIGTKGDGLYAELWATSW